jgi:DNA repair protein RecN (Recombination protein N)
MLSGLTIKNFAIIDDINIAFAEGLTVLTGETGAGKSIIIEAVNLLLGSRASSDLVRSGCKSAELEAFFQIDTDSDAAKLLEEQGLADESGLIVRRIVSATGASKVYINSRQATLDFLKQVTQDLAGISSQHAHQGLLKEENQLAILDEFAGTLDLSETVTRLYHTIKPLKKKIGDLKKRLADSKQEQEFLQFQIDEIQGADLKPSEDEELEKKRETLQNAAKIFESVNRSIHEMHDAEGSFVERLSTLKNEMELSGRSDEDLLQITEQLSGVVYDLQDISENLRTYSSTIDLDPASLEEVDQRLDLVSKLKRKYGGSLDSLFESLNEMENQVFENSQLEDQIESSQSECLAYEQEINKKAALLSDKRKKAALKLADLAQKELSALEMGNARFEVAFSLIPSKDQIPILTDNGKTIGPDGMDRICFMLSPNPGEPLKQLSKIASGGELSRIVLALKAILSNKKSVETLIFDEVDAGIGGATSEKVGLKLKKLSERHQLICITHLAQIAKYGDYQFRIQKDVVDDRTYTTIVFLENESDRINEIARMIGGADISRATLDHAKEMLNKAGVQL